MIFEFGFCFFPYFITPMMAGGLISIIVKVFSLDRVMGTGAAEFVEDVHILHETNPQVPTKSFERLKNLIGKTLATSWTFGSGVICGLQGPGLLIGCNLGYLFYKSERFSLDMDVSIFTGASACTGVILRSPIGGSLFCAELPYNNHIKYRSLIPSIIAATIAYFIYAAFFGLDPFLQLHEILNVENVNYIYFIFLSIIFGIFSELFLFVFMGLLRGFINKLSKFFTDKTSIWILPFLGTILYSLFLFLIVPYLGGDFENLIIGPDSDYLTLFTNLISASIPWYILFLFIVIFLIGIFLSIGTLNSAGIILPLILLGTLLEGFFGDIFYQEYLELFVILGISSVLGAATNNPISAIVIVIEMSWLPILFIPVAISTILAYIFAGPSSLIPEQKYIYKKVSIVL
ncbi:MAG: chloride channel protein [Promethearchaeati archaeon]